MQFQLCHIYNNAIKEKKLIYKCLFHLLMNLFKKDEREREKEQNFGVLLDDMDATINIINKINLN